MNNRNAAKYAPVQKPTAAVQRVHRDYRVKHPSNIASPRTQIHPNAPINRPSGTPNYRSTNKGYSNTRSFGFGGRRRR